MGMGLQKHDQESAGETVVTGNQCAAGMPQMIALDPANYRPLPSAPTDTIANGAVRQECHLCSQMVLVKIREPRKGFFVEHASSHQGWRGAGDFRPGKPARERRQ